MQPLLQWKNSKYDVFCVRVGSLKNLYLGSMFLNINK
jgi:hypothetical protein